MPTIPELFDQWLEVRAMAARLPAPAEEATKNTAPPAGDYGTITSDIVPQDEDEVKEENFKKFLAVGGKADGDIGKTIGRPSHYPKGELKGSQNAKPETRAEQSEDDMFDHDSESSVKGVERNKIKKANDA